LEFYPAALPVPDGVRTARLTLRPLRATDVKLDYEAVMSSAEMLRSWSQSDWPAGDFTLAQNLADLQRHELQHAERTAFAFTVLDPAGARCLGCVYIEPPWPEAHALCAGARAAAEVAFWVRTPGPAGGLDRHLLDVLIEWFEEEWAFDCLLFRAGPQDEQRAALLAAAGLRECPGITWPDGRAWRIFGQGRTAR
jgi:hypothetical protein